MAAATQRTSHNVAGSGVQPLHTGTRLWLQLTSFAPRSDRALANLPRGPPFAPAPAYLEEDDDSNNPQSFLQSHQGDVKDVLVHLGLSNPNVAMTTMGIVDAHSLAIIEVGARIVSSSNSASAAGRSDRSACSAKATSSRFRGSSMVAK